MKTKTNPRAQTSPLDRFEAKLLKKPSYRKVHAETALVARISVRLIEHRAKHGLTQAALAAAAGISRKALNEIEVLAQTNPGLKTLEALAQALRIPVATLLA
jgi:DNA-binding XRE family transcriptional regulator